MSLVINLESAGYIIKYYQDKKFIGSVVFDFGRGKWSCGRKFHTTKELATMALFQRMKVKVQL